MDKPFFVRLFKYNIDSLLAALLGMTMVLLLTKHSGLGISPDSIYYISAADSFLAGHGFYQFDEKPFVMFPVFYPFVLSIVKWVVGNGFLNAAPYWNAFLFGVLIFLSGIILEKSNHVKWVKWILLLMIALSPSLLEVYTMLWSETLFIVEILLFIYISNFYFESNQIKHLLILAIVSAIAADTRLAGVSLIATGGLLILFNQNVNWLHRWKHAFMYGLISVSLFVINLLRNAHLSQTLTGNRQKGVTPFIENLKYYGLVISDWLPFSKWTSTFPVVLGGLFLLLIAILFMYRWIYQLHHHFYEKIVGAFTLIYSIFMLTVATISRFETINNRLLAPFYIPCILTLSFYIVSTIKWAKSKQLKWSLALVFVMLSAQSFAQYFRTDKASFEEYSQGGIGGYSDDDWFISSGLLNYLKQNPAFFKTDKVIYSNAAHAIYFSTQQHSQILPERKYQNLVKDFNNLPAQILIWFNKEDNLEVLTLEEVQKTKNMQIIGKFNDGVIYICTSK